MSNIDINTIKIAVKKTEQNYNKINYIESANLVEDMPNCIDKLNLRLRLKAIKTVIDNDKNKQINIMNTSLILDNIVKNNDIILEA